MAERKRREASWSRGDHVLSSGEVAEKGKMACLDTASGEVVAGQASTTLVPLGYFDENLTGDGTKKVAVSYFRERVLHWWDNSSSADEIGDGDVGSDCYIASDTAVALTDGTGTRSKAGRIMAVSARYGVLVEMAD